MMSVVVDAADCEDDDLDCGTICRLLATTTRLLCGAESISGRHPSQVDAACLHHHLLVRYE